MNKILTLDQLADFITKAKSQGKKVVQAHGCFDLLHPGHIRHLKTAKSHADLLVVTVTPDRFVNKGPQRPQFPENLRLETLAALEFVDAVALNSWATAIETINLLKPDIYIKGSEYLDPSKDPTGMIVEEKQAIEAAGGHIEYTDEITFSSTSILNNNFNLFSSEAEVYLRQLAQKYNPHAIKEMFSKAEDWSVVIVGDAIIDEYCYVRPMGRVEKAPIVACRYLSTEFFAGGILAIANHVANFVKQVDLFTVVGNDDLISRIEGKLSPKIKLHLSKRDDGPTTLKRRYLQELDLQKMFALEVMNDHPISPDTETDLLDNLSSHIKKSDLVIAGDFGHGAITAKIIDRIEKQAKFLAVNAQTNSSNFGFNPVTRYPRADLISIDENELRIATRSKFDSVENMLKILKSEIDCPKINITLGANGSHYFCPDNDFKAPALTSNVIDTVGAGDAVFAVLSICAALELPDEVMPLIGNCAGAIASNTLCNEIPINKSDLLKMIKTALLWS